MLQLLGEKLQAFNCSFTDLFRRVMMLTGSGLSPWALKKERLTVKRKVAQQTGCQGEMMVDDWALYLTTKPLSDLLAVQVGSPQFLPGFTAFVNDTVLTSPKCWERIQPIRF